MAKSQDTRHFGPLSFMERIAFGSEVDGEHERAEEAAKLLEQQALQVDPDAQWRETDRLAERMRARREQLKLKRPPARLAGLTTKQADVLGTLLETPCGLADIEADLARSAWASGWVDWSRSGLYNTLRTLERRGYVDRASERPTVWFITETGAEAQGAYLDAWEDWEFPDD